MIVMLEKTKAETFADYVQAAAASDVVLRLITHLRACSRIRTVDVLLLLITKRPSRALNTQCYKPHPASHGPGDSLAVETALHTIYAPALTPFT